MLNLTHSTYSCSLVQEGLVHLLRCREVDVKAHVGQPCHHLLQFVWLLAPHQLMGIRQLLLEWHPTQSTRELYEGEIVLG